MAEIRVKKKSGSAWPWILGLLALALIIGWWVAQPNEREGVAVAPVAGEMDRDEIVADDADAVAVAPADRGRAEEEGAIPQPVQAFSEFVRDNDRGDMNVDHGYTAQGLRLATAGYASIIDKHGLDAGVRSDLEQIGQQAARLEQNADSKRHADIVKESFTDLSEVADTLAQRLNLQGEQGMNRGAGNTQDQAIGQGIGTEDQMARQGADFDEEERVRQGRDIQGDPMAFRGGDDAQAGNPVEQLRQIAQSIEEDVPLLEQREAVQSFFRQNEQILQRMATATPSQDAAVSAEE